MQQEHFMQLIERFIWKCLEGLPATCLPERRKNQGRYFFQNLDIIQILAIR